MSSKSYKSTITCWKFLLAICLGIASHAFVDGKNSLDVNRLLPKAKGTIKTIECPEDGDVIDCIDFWKQPAFDDPIIKKSQMEQARSLPKAYEIRNGSKSPIMFHQWNKYGECPQGTIPIRRTPKNNSSIYDGKFLGPDGYEHEHAIVRYPRGTYHGTRAILNVWKPYVERNTRELSIAQIWILSDVAQLERQNTIEAGWMVHPIAHHGDNRPRFFTYWTRSGYVGTGCYNMDCPGFVITNPTFSFGCALGLTSIYGGAQFVFKLEIEMDHVTGSWWLHINDIEIGYWPFSIFTTLSQGADILDWGGEVTNQRTGGRHTHTEMGSGHFPHSGFSKAAFIGNIEIKDVQNNWNDANVDLFTPHIASPGCYRLEVGVPRMGLRSHFFYGGPGGTRCDET